jgi:hypothetical protein
MKLFMWIFILSLLMNSSLSMAEEETLHQDKIKALSFLVGSWAGEGRSYADDGSNSSYFDTEDVWFDVENSLLIIQAKGFRDNKQFYGIHTVIYYDEAQGHYWYNPYTAKGARAFSCDLGNKVFLCHTPDKTFRLTFRRTESGQWNEFGEKLVDGHWQKTFETLLDKAK